MDLNLKGKIAIVTGSSRGIGKAIAQELYNEGCVVFINARDNEELIKAREDIEGHSSLNKIYTFCGDLTILEEIIKFLEYVKDKTGKYPDIVVSNLGSGASVSGWGIEDKEWERVFSLNFFNAVKLFRESIKRMRNQGGGALLYISSIAGCEDVGAPIPYATAKLAGLGMVKSLSKKIAEFNLRINSLSPGNILFEGGSWDKRAKENSQRVRDYIEREVPMKRFGSPKEIAQVAAFLVSDRASFITGSNIVVDGGQLGGI